MFIRDLGNWFDEVVKLAGLGTDVLMDTGAVISAKPYRAGSWRAVQAPPCRMPSSMKV